MSLMRRLRYSLVGAIYAGYYRARDLNYAYGRPTQKTVGEAQFRSYELYNLHGRDELLLGLLERIENQDTVYDIGANVGVYTCAAASIGAEVVALEPNAEAREKLQQNIDTNGFDTTVLPVAVVDEDGTETFYLSSYPEISSLHRSNAKISGGSVIEQTNVETRTIDSIVGHHPQPDHIKIDVEGAGDDVLRGATDTLKTAMPTVYFEPHGDCRETRDFLHEVGYAVEDLGEGLVCTPR